MTSKSQIGQIGEDMACKYLKSKRYKIICRNYRQKWGELDIIAKAPDKTLVFVEVKTLQKSNFAGLTPEENLTPAKLKKLKRTASLFAGSNQELIDNQKGWRIDLIAITLTNEEKCCDLKHYENI